MKFAEHLAAHITPEWRKQYIQYEELKALLYETLEKAPPVDASEQSVIKRYFANFEEGFFCTAEKELTKINTFFSEKIAESSRKFGNLKSDLNNYYTRAANRNHRSFAPRIDFPSFSLTNKNQTCKLHDLKVAFSEFYLNLILLQNYQTLNFTGFRKILKKHDKLMDTDIGAKWRQTNVDVAPFFVNKVINKLIEDTETLFTQELEKGDRQKAMKRLRVPPLNDQHSPWITFKVGLFSGAFIVLVISMTLSGVYNTSPNIDWGTAFRLFNGPFNIILFIFFIGLNIRGWRTSGVNHVLIFELDPRNHLSEQHLMEISSIFGVLWALSILAYIFSKTLSIPMFSMPLILVTVMTLYTLNPTKTFYRQARFWFLKVLLRVFAAPFVHVNFADFWLADQLNSLVPVFLDILYFICFYSSIDSSWNVHDNAEVCNNYSIYKIFRPIVSCLPAWFRFAQCLRRYRDTKEAFPHLANAFKYSTTFFVVIFSTLYSTFSTSYEYSLENPFFHMWVVSALGSSIYTYWWDTRMDWGLWDSPDLLREETVYSSPGYYYFAIVEDLVLRFTWTITLSVTQLGIMPRHYIVSLLCPLEVFRRFIWNFFRLENEHLNNCGKFRAVRDISVAPMDTSDINIIIRLMDDKAVVTNRGLNQRKKNRSKKIVEHRIPMEGVEV